MANIYHLMERVLRIQEQLEIDKLVYVYDQAIYAKAMNIQLNKPEKFSSLFLIMGTFHILKLLMFLGIIGTHLKI